MVFAACTTGATIALHTTAAAGAAAAVRDLSDGELAKTGIVFTGMPPVSAEELVKRILLGHVDAHFGTSGRRSAAESPRRFRGGEDEVQRCTGALLAA